MTESPVTFSVVLATRDRPALLADALASVASQTIAPLEVLIADDRDPFERDEHEGASARIADIAARTGLATHPIRTIATGGCGAAAARNRAAHEARGTILAFLDDDDRWQPRHLEDFAAAFADAALEVAFRDAAVIREEIATDGRRVDLARRTIAHEWDAELMRHDDFIAPSALAVRHSAFQALGGFDESYAFSEDWDFLLRAAARTRPRRVPGVTVEVRMRASGHLSLDTGSERVACLRKLESRHALPPLVVKTFWEVAEVLGTLPGSGAGSDIGSDSR